MKNILLQIYESPVGTYFCGKKLFERWAAINASCNELSENFSDVEEEKLDKIYVDNKLIFVVSTNSQIFDLLMAHVLENPQVKISYTVDGFTRLMFKFKSDIKAKNFITKGIGLGAIEWSEENFYFG